MSCDAMGQARRKKLKSLAMCNATAAHQQTSVRAAGPSKAFAQLSCMSIGSCSIAPCNCTLQGFCVGPGYTFWLVLACCVFLVDLWTAEAVFKPVTRTHLSTHLILESVLSDHPWIFSEIQQQQTIPLPSICFFCHGSLIVLLP